MIKKPSILVISGPSGSGKGSVIAALPDNFVKTVSVTTRSPRDGEVNGVSYYFITEREFSSLRDEGDLLECNQYDGNWYATRRSQIASILDSGRIAVLDIDVHGAFNLRREYPDAGLIFFMPPDSAEQERRLRDRKTNSEESIRRRLAESRNEIARAPEFDCVVVNEKDLLNRAVSDICGFADGVMPDAERGKFSLSHYFGD